VTTTVNTDVMIVVTVLAVHAEDAIPVGGIFPVEDDRSDEYVVAVLMGAIVVLLLVEVNFDGDEIEAESRNRLLLVVEVLLVVVLLVGKASSWYISNAYAPPQSSRGAPWQRYSQLFEEIGRFPFSTISPQKHQLPNSSPKN
jgi:hypothetical protein